MEFCLYHQCLRYFTCALELIFYEKPNGWTVPSPSAMPISEKYGICYFFHRIGWKTMAQETRKDIPLHSLVSSKFVADAVKFVWLPFGCLPFPCWGLDLLCCFNRYLCILKTLKTLNTLNAGSSSSLDSHSEFSYFNPPKNEVSSTRQCKPWWKEWYRSEVEHRGVFPGSVEPCSWW